MPKSKCLLFLVYTYILRFAFSCVSSSNLLFCMCAYIKLMFLFARVCLHQNGCLFSFASKFKCLLFLLCVFIKMFFYSCLPTSKWLLLILCAYIFMFAFSRVYLYQKVCFSSCVSTSTCFLSLMSANIKIVAFSLLCAYIKMFPNSPLLLLVAPTSKCLPIPLCI